MPLLAATLLAGCASIDGIAEPVVPADVAATIAGEYPVGDALVRFHHRDPKMRNGLTPLDWRNMITGVYLAAIDARYHAFRRNISRESKVSNLGLELGVLGLSGGASIAGEATANALAAGAAALTGSRAAANKELYFEKTLPALLARMDASRTAVKVDILRRLRNEDERSYTLEAAFADLANYQSAASLDGAIERVTSQASEAAAEADQELQALYTAPPPEPGRRERMAAIKARIGDFYTRNDRANLDKVAQAAGVEVRPNLDAQFRDILIFLDKQPLAELNAFAARAAQTTGVAF